MRRLAELPPPWRYVLLALVAVGVWCMLRWVDQDEASAVRREQLHVKLRTGVAVTAARPVFAHHHGDDLARWIELDVDADRAALELAALESSPEVEDAYIVPAYSLPTERRPTDDLSCPITTPSFESYQGYLAAAPGGIDAPAAWRRGVRGGGVWFADIEGGWNASHEDLPGDRITHVSGTPIDDPSWSAHGTAVLGEVVGRDNGKGVVGIAPDIERVFTASIGNQSVADAIDTAAEALRPGDVLLIELQGGGPRGRYLPIEYWDDNFEAIQAATARGVIVIEAAGNGAENLDHSAYKKKFDRWKRDSGAIMIGAGGPPRDGFTDRERLDFSNYGSRVDVQGWGRKVATLDYGDLQRCSDKTDRHYTGEFSGTSSASPIVAGAAVLVQSYVRRETGSYLSPGAMRTLLRETGTPQVGNLKEQIGPRPDLARALTFAVEWTLGEDAMVRVRAEQDARGDRDQGSFESP